VLCWNTFSAGSMSTGAGGGAGFFLISCISMVLLPHLNHMCDNYKSLSVNVTTDIPRVLHSIQIWSPHGKNLSSHIFKNMYFLLPVFKKSVSVCEWLSEWMCTEFETAYFMNIWFYTLMCSTVIHASYRFLSFCILVNHLAFSSFPYIVIPTAYGIA
jgi:hypothetical protein